MVGPKSINSPAEYIRLDLQCQALAAISQRADQAEHRWVRPVVVRRRQKLG